MLYALIPHVQITNFECSNISLKSALIATTFIYISDIDTLLQLLVKDNVYYLEIKARLFEYLRYNLRVSAFYSGQN